jgi:glycosyltransferase involved in cell wall biosynthesis
MAAGRPVVCLDLGGPAVQVTLETGFKVPASDPEQAVDGLATAITTLAKDAGIRSRMGSAGQQRVREHFSWEVKGQQLIQLYQEIVEQEEHQQGNY